MLIDDLQTLKKIVLFVAVAMNLAILYYFKYFNFILDSINKVLGSAFVLEDIVLPIGISFFTFQ